MKNFNLKPITLILAVALVTVLMAAKFPENNKQYEYVSIVQEGKALKISMTENSKFETINIKDKKEDSEDFNPLFEKVKEFEAQGYEVMQNTASGGYANALGSTGTTTYIGQGIITNYILMRKAK